MNTQPSLANSRRHGTVIVWSLVSSTAVLIAGCGPADPSASNATASLSQDRSLNDANSIRQHRVDAGIVFLGQASYRCQPLADLGIESAEEIHAIKSSCECIEAQAVTYQKSASQVADALRLDFIAEKPSLADGTADFRPIPLAAVVTIELVTGEIREVTVDFLYTRQVASGVGS